MAAARVMNSRAQLDAQLDQLAQMLPPWLEKLRHDAQFWPQFNALAQQILQHAEADDRPNVLQRLDAMLKEYDESGRPRPPAPPVPPLCWGDGNSQGIARRNSYRHEDSALSSTTRLWIGLGPIFSTTC